MSEKKIIKDKLKSPNVKIFKIVFTLFILGLIAAFHYVLYKMLWGSFAILSIFLIDAFVVAVLIIYFIVHKILEKNRNNTKKGIFLVLLLFASVIGLISMYYYVRFLIF